MIHLVAFQNLDSGIGYPIYSDDTINVSLELIFPMISALNNFVEECTNDERGLVNAALEDVKIFLYAPEGEENPLRYVFFTDIFDDNLYLSYKAVEIHKHLSPYIKYDYFSIPEEKAKKITEIITFTHEFPRKELSNYFLSEVENKIKSYEKNKEVFFGDLFIGDLDQGIVLSFFENDEIKEKPSKELFSELIQTFTFLENDLWANSSINEIEKDKLSKYVENPDKFREGWFLSQLASYNKSDFWLVGYFVYRTDMEQEVKEFLYSLSEKITSIISPFITKRKF
ncbi:MAG: hypothetical protein K9W45_13540 [Candidatus Heimdallarchaeum aukensis]|uniref:Uncharacterized protein n=1 Tax=Candidatus Heimdallarchaeum aukensis TaxID=2876573 RepID=A0A9Y1BKQ7_9ARCH|nr:MAG: hypothetical protein K9W45_13540 [Candidatus Heimdallarchaeum aukensis]